MADEKKLYLNIQQQVEKNRTDILDIQKGATVLAEFGIKIVGQVDSVEDLPDPATYEGDYGDAYAVGTEKPYDFYIFTRAYAGETEPQWFDLGEFPKAGPQGETGATGETGPKGDSVKVFTSSDEYVSGTQTYLLENIYNTGRRTLEVGDMILFSNGYMSTVEMLTVSPGVYLVSTMAFLIKGEQGANGGTGPQGIQGPKGDKGDQGEQGQPAPLYNLLGKVDSIDDLPSPTSVSRNSGYIVGANDEVYVIMGPIGQLSWYNIGPLATLELSINIISETFQTSGTLSSEMLIKIINTEGVDILKDGDRFFIKQSAGNYYALKRENNVMKVFSLALNLETGAWTVTTEEMVDIDTEQTITGKKNFSNIGTLSDGTNTKTLNDIVTMLITASERAKLAKALVTPTVYPATRKLVSINTSGEQEQIDLELPDGTGHLGQFLKYGSSGPMWASVPAGGTKLYRHIISVTTSGSGGFPLGDRLYITSTRATQYADRDALLNNAEEILNITSFAQSGTSMHVFLSGYEGIGPYNLNYPDPSGSTSLQRRTLSSFTYISITEL